MVALPIVALSLGLVARAPGRCPAARMGARLDGMVLGEAVSPEVLQQLGIEGKRAAVAFFCRDNGHECGQELRDLESDFESLAKRTDEAEVVLFSESGWTPDIRFGS